MSKIKLFDRLANFIAGLGTERDKAAGGVYVYTPLSDQQLSAAYMGNWLPRKIVNIPPRDATRNWRSWQGTAQEITLMEAEEKRLGLRAKVREAMTKARLFGGAVIIIGSNDTDLTKPLEPSRFSRGRPVPYLVVLTRQQCPAGELENDPLKPGYGLPKYYTPANSSIQLHPSRVVRFIGEALPDDGLLTAGTSHGYGDSVLNVVSSALLNTDSVISNVASLVFEAKVDVFRIPDMMQQMADPKYRDLMLQRASLAAMGKGINGTLFMDKEEEYQSKSANFGSLDAILDRYFQVAAGAADIPLTRLFGVAAKGLGNGGEADMANYYDTIRGMQELEMGPEMALLDQCLTYGALGTLPANLHYNWRSLWLTTPSEQANIGKTISETLKNLGDTGAFNADALSKAGANALVEAGALPGLEDAMGEFEGSDQPEAEEAPTPARVADAAPAPLYVSRKVLNAEAIRAWARGQGLPVIEAAEMHVTIAYSRTPVDWMKINPHWAASADGKLTIAAGGPRMLDKFGEAIVLLFNSWELSSRHADIREAGASWDHADYQPHITIAYNSDANITGLEPYTGPIELGPEIFEALNENWSEDKV